jgi:SSS family solute:Na+ symporter/sodium/pantothenate symporter
MTAIVVTYLILAPKLFTLAKRHVFITPTDFLAHRFQHRGLNLLATLIMVAALLNFYLAQLTAMGRAVEGLTTLPPDTAFAWGVGVLAAVMLLYETLGGFRAVAWTDMIQGGILAVGFVVLMALIFVEYGSLEA